MAPLRFSDHRPVYATFQCTVSIVDEGAREVLSRKIYERRRSEVGGTVANTAKDDTDDEDLIGYDSIEPGLPPASSDRRKWWLDNGQPARSAVRPSHNGMIPNPMRPSNPYTMTDEEDWVTVNRANQISPPPQTTTSVTRKLPPPFHPSNNPMSSLSNNMSRSSLQDAQSGRDGPTKTVPGPERRLSTSSTASSKRAPPPIGRKPVHLSSSRSSTSSPTLSAAPKATPRNALPPVQNSRSTTIDHTGFAPPPRRATVQPASTVTYGRKEIVERRDVSTPPPPPQSRRTGIEKRPTTVMKPDNDESPRPGLPPRRPTDLLADDSDAGLSGWEALKPT